MKSDGDSSTWLISSCSVSHSFSSENRKCVNESPVRKHRNRNVGIMATAVPDLPVKAHRTPPAPAWAELVHTNRVAFTSTMSHMFFSLLSGSQKLCVNSWWVWALQQSYSAFTTLPCWGLLSLQRRRGCIINKRAAAAPRTQRADTRMNKWENRQDEACVVRVRRSARGAPSQNTTSTTTRTRVRCEAPLAQLLVFACGYFHNAAGRCHFGGITGRLGIFRLHNGKPFIQRGT